MTLTYLPVTFRLKFADSTIADTHPLFVLRSMLGKELRSMCCVSRTSACPECMYNRICAYSFLFETILPQDNAVVPGRNRASQPFAFTRAAHVTGRSLQDYEFTMTLFGKAQDYLPYIYMQPLSAQGKTACSGRARRSRSRKSSWKAGTS